MKHKAIIIGKGLEGISFGMDRNALHNAIGNPTEIDRFAYPDGDLDQAESHHFDEHEFSVSFDESEDWRLTSMAVSGEDYTLNDVKFVGMEKERLIEKLNSMDLGEVSVQQLLDDDDDISSDDDENFEMVSIPEANINFWMDDDVVSEIQWGPFYNADEEIIWPS